MTQRITEKMLQLRVDYLNKITGNPSETYMKTEDGHYKAQVGNYHLDHAYGGVALNQMNNTSGGISRVLDTGYTTKRDLFNCLCAFIEGIETVQRGQS